MHLTVSDARKSFADIVDQARLRGERIRLSKNGHEVVAVIPIADLELLEQLEDLIELEEARRLLKTTPESDFVDLADVKKELGL